jgi:hypothetical protein
MRVKYTAIATLLTLLVPVSLFSAANPLQKITIKGGGLPKPIEIFDPQLVTRFFYGSGPGNSSWHGPSFVVDWPRGVAAEPQKELPAYDVEFLTSRTGLNTYRVTYVYDPGEQEGFVYLPGSTDPRYRENTWLILRSVEGNWFHAWSEWDVVAKRLLASSQ